jgi:pimeloyl-ACP methyl ester carboxylesterase
MRKRKKSQSLGDGYALPALLVGAALAADIGRRVYRRTQLFCASHEPTITWNPTDYGIPEGATEEVWIETPDGETLHAWYCRAENPVASTVFCHGNTGNLTLSAHVIPHLLAAGTNTLFFDYRGFGKSSGTPSLSGVIADGITASRFHDRIRPKKLASVLYGYSLGGAIAAQVIRRHPYDGLILQSTFTSLPKLARFLFPRVPMHLISGNPFDTLKVVSRLQVPLLVLHGTNDETCPCAMGQELAQACPAPKRTLFVEEGMHKDLFLRDPDAVIWAVSQFISELHPGRTYSVDEPPAFEEWINTMLRTVRKWMRRKTPQQA